VLSPRTYLVMAYWAAARRNLFALCSGLASYAFRRTSSWTRASLSLIYAKSAAVHRLASIVSLYLLEIELLSSSLLDGFMDLALAQNRAISDDSFVQGAFVLENSNNHPPDISRID
jgi:hypothetical protein